MSDKGLITITAIDSQGLEEISLSPFSCKKIAECATYGGLFNFIAGQLEVLAPNETYNSYADTLEKIFEGKITFSRKHNLK